MLVVTDSQLNEIESVNLRCRRHPHIVPAFGALMTTGINPETLDQANMSNYDMASELTNYSINGRQQHLLATTPFALMNLFKATVL